MTAENVVAKAKREAVVILGMHRSGTSALGGVLTRLGAQAPRTLMIPTKDNPRGYFESLELLKVHESILRSAGSRWNDWGPVNPDWLDTPTAEQFQLRLVETLQKEFGDAPLFLIKDPRACLFFPLWRRALKSAGVIPKVVFQLRHPLEVAQSLEARDQFSRTRSLLLWLRYVLEGERGSRKLPRAFVHYRDLLGNWQAAVQRVGKALGVKWPKYSGDTVFAIEEFLSSELRHHTFQDAEVAAVQPLAGWVSEAYAALNHLALPRATKASAQSTLDRIRAEFDASAGVYAAVVREHETRIEGLYASAKKQLAEKSEESNDLSARLQQAAKERDTGRVAHEKQAVEL
ncbi:MAG TPA: sulfotransferase, partial [Gammaproteobacteria bacterium]|nr:sulfotransferase [Gammaproteobacteria bacterium]